jgi:hypothetical protein
LALAEASFSLLRPGVMGPCVRRDDPLRACARPRSHQRAAQFSYMRFPCLAGEGWGGGSHKRCARGPDFVALHPGKPLRHLRARRNLLKQINLIWAVQSHLQKYFGFRTPQITSRTLRIPSHTSAVSRTRGGMRWTRQRFARDEIAGRVERLVSDQQHADERRFSRTAKSCGPDAPTLASSSRSSVGPTGRGQNLTLRMTVAKEPGHRGERDISC